MRYFGLVFLFTTFLLAYSHAQESVGRTVVDGNVVILFDDGTWQYQSADSNCSTVSKGLNVCPKAGGWARTTDASPDAAGTFRLDDRNYALIIVEELGVEDGLDKAFMTNAVIYNVAVGAGIAEEEVMTLDIQDRTMFGRDARTISYGARMDGVDIVYINSIVFSADRTTQLITYSVGNELTDKKVETHENFVSTVRFD